MGGDSKGGGTGGGGRVPPNIFDGPMLKPLNNYCWLCGCFFVCPTQPWWEIAAAGRVLFDLQVAFMSHPFLYFVFWYLSILVFVLCVF